MSFLAKLLATAIITTAFLPACDSSERTIERGDVVNLYSNTLTSSDQQLFEPFEKASGLRVNIIFGMGEELVKRASARKHDSTNADLLLLRGIEHLRTAQESNLIDTLFDGSFFTAVPSHLRGEDRQWLGLAYSTLPIAYRADSLDSLQVRNYQQLAEERWQGRIFIPQDEEVATALLAAHLAGQGREATKTWWGSLLRNRTDSLDSLSLLQIAYVKNYQPDEDWRLVFPQPETYLQVTGLALCTYAPRPAYAKSLFTYMFSRAFVKRYCEKYRLYPGRTDVEQPATLVPAAAFQPDTTAQDRIAGFTDEARILARGVFTP